MRKEECGDEICLKLSKLSAKALLSDLRWLNEQEPGDENLVEIMEKLQLEIRK